MQEKITIMSNSYDEDMCEEKNSSNSSLIEDFGDLIGLVIILIILYWIF